MHCVDGICLLNSRIDVFALSRVVGDAQNRLHAYLMATEVSEERFFATRGTSNALSCSDWLDLFERTSGARRMKCAVLSQRCFEHQRLILCCGRGEDLQLLRGFTCVYISHLPHFISFDSGRPPEDPVEYAWWIC